MAESIDQSSVTNLTHRVTKNVKHFEKSQKFDNVTNLKKPLLNSLLLIFSKIVSKTNLIIDTEPKRYFYDQ